jgi:hypothetical protein
LLLVSGEEQVMAMGTRREAFLKHFGQVLRAHGLGFVPGIEVIDASFPSSVGDSSGEAEVTLVTWRLCDRVLEIKEVEGVVRFGASLRPVRAGQTAEVVDLLSVGIAEPLENLDSILEFYLLWFPEAAAARDDSSLRSVA